MTSWSYPGPEGRQQKQLQGVQPRWYKPQWKSLAWAVQLLMALDLFFVIMLPLSSLHDALWWITLFMTIVLFVLVSVLAVRR